LKRKVDSRIRLRYRTLFKLVHLTFVNIDSKVSIETQRTMQVPNRYHHSKKEQKRKLKPQALRQAKARRQALKNKHSERSVFFINI
jgi:hypothetical protein